MMAIKFCPTCSMLLSDINIDNGTRTCTSCGFVLNLKKTTTKEDRLLKIQHFNTGSRIITDKQIHMLSGEVTTQKVMRDCPNTKCQNNVLSLIYDESYSRITLSCEQCGGIFENNK